MFGQTIKLVAASVALTLIAVGASATTYYRGEMNGWGTTALDPDNDFGGGNYYFATVTATVDDASSDFKFDTGSWTFSWGAGTAAQKNQTRGQANHEGSGDLSFANASNTYRYTFRLKDPEHYWLRDYVVMETLNDPVSIVGATSGHLQDPATNPVAVAIQLSAEPSPQEQVWIRFTTGSFENASMLLSATGSSTNYTAIIPAQPAGAQCEYYVLTSTMPSNQIVQDYDLCTLRGGKSGAVNFSFRFGAANAWHIPTNAEPASVTMRNPAESGMPASSAVYFYSGSQTSGVGNAANQSGMTLYHREAGSAGEWQSIGAAFDTGSGNNAYWIASITGDTYAAGTEVEYYLKLDFTDHNTTFLGADGSDASLAFLVEGSAQSSPFVFSYGEPPAPTNYGNAWHYPGNYEPVGTYMRNPRNPYSNNVVHIFSGNQFQGEGTAGNQTGGTLRYRQAGAGEWSAAALTFDSEAENNKYWRGEIPAGTFGAGAEVEYHLEITYSDRDTTWLGTVDQSASVICSNQAAAEANSFRFTYGGEPGTEAGFMWHNSNRVNLAEGTVQFWVKIGYAQGDGVDRWVDNACIYYTTNGQPAAATGKGTGDANTLVQTMSFSHIEPDSSENGNAMWWVGTASNLPLTGDIRYRIGAWNGTGVQRFAEYNTDGENDKEFVFSLHVPGAEGLQVNGRPANYTTTKFFVDERANDEFDVAVVYNIPGSEVIEAVEVFSNLDRRDYADVDYNSDGIPDGIKPPLGGAITTNDTGAYFRAYPMSHLGGREYGWTGKASKCGAYRLTARYKLQGNPEWFWYSSEGRRDHAIVVSPKKALEMTLYEVNPLTVKATHNDKNGRSTFSDLLTGNQDSFTNFNLGYLNKLQVNCLWFQPIHPSAATTRGDPSGYDPGSPYATRDYFSVAPIMGRGDTEESALNEFTNFVLQCDTYAGGVGPIHIMLDGVFNHTAWDAVMGQGGVDLGFAATPSESMPAARPGWYSHWQDYGSPATFYSDVYTNDIAVAPDRGDFGKWEDTADLYFGKYSALVRHNPENNGDYLNEDDVYDFDGMSSDNVDLWRYFGYYTEYWLKKTGHPTNNNNAASDDLGIDALRCDFGQGLPPQLWEYIINRTRKMKWNFVFMAETLDGGKPGYRSNRHFDILNENIVFKFTQERISDSWQLREAMEDRRNGYSGGAILLNMTGHDEAMPDNDPWLVASRYGAVSTVEGLPMIFYGQEWGIQNFNPADGDNPNDGFLTYHESNFGKYIPHFKQWNKLTVWEQPPAFSDGLAQWYGRVNWARLNSPALRSHNRYFLNKVGGGEDARIFAVAKYEQAFASPAEKDVVLAFAIMLPHGLPHSAASATYDLQPCWDILGLDTGKHYNVRNIASSDASAYVWGSAQSGADIYNNGVFVSLNAGTGANGIADDGELVQYLKIDEIDVNNSPVLTVPSPHVVPVGSSTNFIITATDPDADAVFVTCTTNLPGATFEDGTFSWTVPAAFVNTTNNVVFAADDQRGEANSVVTSNSVIIVPYDSDEDAMSDGWEWTSFGTLEQGPDDDGDDDGVGNRAEFIAGTDPTSVSSVFEINDVISESDETNHRITIPTQPGRLYTIYFTDSDLSAPSWSAFSDLSNGIGTWIETNDSPSTHTFIDTESGGTSGASPAEGRRFYRVKVQGP